LKINYTKQKKKKEVLAMTLTETLAQLQQENLALVYISMPNCSVCHAVKPQVEQLAKNQHIPLYAFDAAKEPQVASTFEVLTAPAVLLYERGKEINRQARFIDFERLSFLITESVNQPQDFSYADLFKK
jgi:thioredoxin-like negative regulator of GroEL